MINLMSIKLTAIIRKQQIVSQDTIDMEKYNKALQEYIYPLGILPMNAFDTNSNLSNLSEQEKLDYFSDLLHSMYNTLYTEEEYNIIYYYLLTRIQGKLTYTPKLIEQLEALVISTQTKKDIIYLQEELKFRLATHYSLTMTNDNRLFELLDELESIEDTHNAFQMELRKEKT